MLHRIEKPGFNPVNIASRLMSPFVSCRRDHRRRLLSDRYECHVDTSTSSIIADDTNEHSDWIRRPGTVSLGAKESHGNLIDDHVLVWVPLAIPP
jgi:hypothetical protein